MAQAARSRPLDGAFRYRHRIEIRYGDTDALGHVNNAVYLSYFEMARGGYYTAVVGHPFGRGPEADRRTYVIAEAHVTYRTPALYGEALACACRVGWLGRSSFSLEYRLEVEASAIGPARLIADGSTVQVFFDFVEGRVMRIPEVMAQRLVEFEGRSLPGRPAGA
jgi:acyl-CoA thioester hydrolase